MYIVWVPMSRGLERDVPNATREVWDPRARHYWDHDGQLVKGFQETLGYSEPAWDTYVLYAGDTTWTGDRPPAPNHFMHQLGSKRRPRVRGDWWDPGNFLLRVRSMQPAASSQ